MISPAMMLPPTVLIRNGGIKNQAAAALFKKKRAMTQAVSPPKIPVPKISSAIAALTEPNLL